MKRVNKDGSEAPMWIKRLENCITQNQQWDHGDEQIHRDHQ